MSSGSIAVACCKTPANSMRSAATIRTIVYAANCCADWNQATARASACSAGPGVVARRSPALIGSPILETLSLARPLHAHTAISRPSSLLVHTQRDLVAFPQGCSSTLREASTVRGRRRCAPAGRERILVATISGSSINAAQPKRRPAGRKRRRSESRRHVRHLRGLEQRH